MTNKYSIPSDELKQWQNLYNQSFTINGKESIIQTDGTKQLFLLPMMTYTVISTMLEKLKFLPSSCFNRLVIGETPICGLRSLNATSPSLMYTITEILRVLVDGVRKQHIISISMVFYKKNDINTVYDSYSLLFDYSIKLSDNESTSIEMIAHIIRQIEYMFEWNDPLPSDVELTFILSTLDQFENNENKVPAPFHFVKQKVEKIYIEHETNQLMGRLTTSDGKMWLKFLPTTRQLSGSSIHSDELPTKANLLRDKSKSSETKSNNRLKSPIQVSEPTMVKSPKLKRNNKKSAILIDVSKSGTNIPSLLSSESTKSKKKTGFLSAVKSLITPLRTPAPVTSSTPNIPDVVLIRHTSTPKPGETASRITIGGNDDAQPLSAIDEASTSADISSPVPSTITATDISTATTPMITVERRNPARAPTVRGQTATTRKKIASMRIQDDDDDDDDDDDNDDNERFKKLFTRQNTKKSKNKSIVSTTKPDASPQVSTISSPTSNSEAIFTPPSTRKRPTTDRMGDDDLAAEHSTPPKTPRTSRRNRNEDQTPIQSSLMDTSDVQINIDSPRLLRSVTKKLQQRASAKKVLAHETETKIAEQSKVPNTTKDQEAMEFVYINLERSSIGLHYSMEDSD